MPRWKDEIRQAARDLEWIAQIPAHVWLRLALLPILLCAWSMLARIAPDGYIAGPYLTLRAFFQMLMDDRHKFPVALWQTVSVYVAGLGLAAAIGIPLGLLLGMWRILGRTLSPYVHALAATPVVALIPLIILMVGLGAEAKVVIVTLSAVMPVLIATEAGVRGTDPDLLEMARGYGLGPLARLRRVILPGALPQVMAGLRLGAVMGLVATAISELYTAMTGLGAMLQSLGNTYRMDSYFAVVMTFAAIGALATGLLSWLEYRLTPPPDRARRAH
ncbi:Putative aliphatic sulfonates transport permease protein SsuC [Marinibacterium anthonyi]|nr:Putative aliphatic sulfonates transport permease protein SsuC [Marinibacterium anthonyi]